MVLSEVSKDPPSPFLTVQSNCDGILLPAVPPAPAAEQQETTSLAAVGGSGDCNINSSSGGGGSKSWRSCQQSCGSHTNGHAPSASHAGCRTHLQSIVSQQSLNFSVPPDSPFEFEAALNSIAAASAVSDSHQNGKQHALAAAAAADGQHDFAAQQYHGGGAADDSANDIHNKAPKGLPRLLGGGWLRATQSLPHCSVLHKRHHSAAGQQPLPLQELSFRHSSAALDKPHAAAGGPLELHHHPHLQHMVGKKLKTRVNKLLAWASGKNYAASEAGCSPQFVGSPQLMSAPLGAYGSLTFAPGSSSCSQQQQHLHHQHSLQQQQQAVPVPWQHQVFTEPSVQLINATPGTPTPLRSPRSSLVSSPSSCDCPLLLGRFSSTGSDGGYGRSPGHVGGCSSGSQGCSLTTTPSPGKASASPGLRCVAGGGSSMNGCTAAAGVATSAAAVGQDASLLKMTSSVRTAHHRHRQHKPGCRFHHQQQQQNEQQQQQQQQQQQGLPGHIQPPLLQPLPSSPSMNGLVPQSSLRTALQQLETMASVKAARIMDKLNAGLQRMTSHRVFDGVLRQGTVGKEVMRDWELGPALGVGASCVTRLVTDKLSGRTAACKSISKQGILHSSVVKAAMLAVQREVAILQAVIGHPHVVALHAVYEDVHNLHMIMDWCGGGSLWQLMERCPGYMLPESAAAAATKAVLEVLAHCHARGVMHRDIKPDNLLVAKPLEGPQQLTADLIKVTDFGISVPFTPGQVLTELAGTMGYMAPEVLRRCYSEAADVWSTGVMLYEMIAGQLPFNLGHTCEECLANIEDADLDLSCPAWQAAAPEARKLVSAMLAKDPMKRPPAQKLLDEYSSWLSRGNQLPAEEAQAEQ